MSKTFHKPFSNASGKGPIVAGGNNYSCNISLFAAAGNRSLQQRGERTRLAKEVATQFRVSLATAFRHLRHGTTPATERVIGRDGKRYPAALSSRPPVSAVTRELRKSRAALLRADDRAVLNGIKNADLSLLQEILRLAQDAVVRWDSVL